MENETGRRPELQPFAERMRKIRAELEMNREEFAASINVSEGAVGNWEVGANSITSNRLSQLVATHGVNPDWVRTGRGEMWMGDGTRRGRSAAPLVDGIIPTLPVYMTESVIEGGAFVKRELLERIDLPTPLIGHDGAYGLFISGNGMAPAFRYGDRAFVDPLLPPIEDTEVVLVRAERHEGDEVSIIATLTGYDANNWTVATSPADPTRRTKLPRAEWPKCHRIVGKYARR